ncbi:MAG: PCRF domain-containing protein, partial [Planctomycetes bacterium]|nr:PCRF domain-containing protein [Planctomycetota bacterium]
MTSDVDSRLRDKLQAVAEQYDQITEQLGDPKVAGDPNLSIRLAKEMGRLRRLAEPFRDYCRMFDQLEEAQSIVADSEQDAELRKLAREEIPDLQEDCDRRWESLKESLVTA